MKVFEFQDAIEANSPKKGELFSIYLQWVDKEQPMMDFRQDLDLVLLVKKVRTFCEGNPPVNAGSGFFIPPRDVDMEEVTNYREILKNDNAVKEELYQAIEQALGNLGPQFHDLMNVEKPGKAVLR